MKSRIEYLSCIHKFINEFYPYAYSIMVTGSFVTEYFNEASDIDIIIVSNLYKSTFVESYDYEGIKMQVIMFPLYDLDALLNKDVMTGIGVYIDQLIKGKILKEPVGGIK